MDRGKLHFSSSKARRGLLYVMVVGWLVLSAVPTREVESMPQPTGTTVLFGPGNNVGANEPITSVVALGDLDNNGDLDIVSGSGFYGGAKVRAWRNDGTPFSGLWAAQDVGTNDYYILSAALGDLDNDGDLDIVSASQSDVRAFENDGTPFIDPWNQNEVGVNAVGPVALADLDNDGDLDIVSKQGAVKVLENDGSPFAGYWTENEVGTWSMYSVAVGDLDNDGDVDIVAGTGPYHFSEVIALQNDGTPFSDPWAQQPVGACADTVVSLALGDLDNDGDLDIVSRSDYWENYEFISWENDGTPFDDFWNGSYVGLAQGCSVALGDLDGDADLDIVSGIGHQLKYWGNDGRPFAGLWPQHPVGSIEAQVVSVAVGDLDDDGDLDIVSGSYWQDDYELKAWENLSLFGTWVPFAAKRLPYFCDDFSDPSSGWYVADTDNVKYSYVAGEYEILLRKTYWMAAVAAPTRAFANGSVEADMQLRRSTTGAYGLIFGLQDWEHFFLFIVDPGVRYYSLWRASPDGWVNLVDWTYSPHILAANGENHLKIERNGSELALYVNGHLLTTTSLGSSIAAQATGLYAQTWEERPTSVRFDNFCARPLGTTTEVGESSVTLGTETSEGRGPVPAPPR